MLARLWLLLEFLDLVGCDQPLLCFLSVDMGILASVLPLNIYGALVVLHLLAACVWLGGHVVLAYLVSPNALDGRNPDTVYRIQSLYDKIGMPSLVLQVLTGFVLAYLHTPDLAAWVAFESPMGRLIALKLVLQLVVLGLALDLRIRLFARVGSAGLGSLRLHVFVISFVSAALVFLGASFRIGWLY